jgi:hypothetical protein
MKYCPNQWQSFRQARTQDENRLSSGEKGTETILQYTDKLTIATQEV